MKPQLFFIHIEKTAGSSLMRSLIRPNVEKVQRADGIRQYLQHRDEDCIHGHNPYGYHVFTRRPIQYITMLRDPVDRAISYYYFIKDLVRTDLWKRHPLRDYADSVTLVEFFQNPRFSNMQARYMAGYLYHQAYPHLHKGAAFRRRLVEASRKHLDACLVYGLQCRYDDSVELFQRVMEWSAYEPVPPQAKTKKRPTITEIQTLNPSVVPELRALHQLDYELYRYARARFEEQCVEEEVLA